MALTTVRSTGISSLPAISAANLTSIPAANITGTLPAIDGSALTGLSSGLEEYDMWVVTSSFNNVPGYINSNWSRFSDTGFEKIGTGVSNSGYNFTFPSTGKYIVDFHVCAYINDTNKARFFEADIEFTNDDWSNSHRLGEQYNYIASGIANTYNSMMSTALVDITNTTNDKIRFRIGCSDDTTWAYIYGTSGTLTTGATFRKVGAT